MIAPRTNGIERRQSGNALIAALFMIIVVAALGVFAMRIGSNQQQTANLALLISRADAAAFSGLEYGARRAKSGGLVCGPLPSINGFNVVVVGCNVPAEASTDGEKAAPAKRRGKGKQTSAEAIKDAETAGKKSPF